jgi:putative addiction module CopG family antidote
MNTPLTPKIEKLIEERLQSGKYKSASEVIEDAFAALREREAFEAVRADLNRADDQRERSENAEYDEDAIKEMTGRIIARCRAILYRGA